jgi:hypothetical protein
MTALNTSLNNTLNFILGSDSLTVFVDGASYTINKQAKTYELVLQAVRSKDINAVRSAVKIKETIVSSLSNASTDVRIKGASIFYKDREVTGLIASRVFEVIRLGLDVQPMVKFIENLMQNPSKRAVDELFGFLEACTLPITPDGHFLAYKRVREDYLDCHSGTMDNSVGNVLEMDRNAVDDDKNRTCSAGLHFCSFDYLKSFSGERIVIVKINPKDVVAIPADYNNSKGRTCRYEVVGESELNGYKLPHNKLDEGFTLDFWYNEAEVAADFVKVEELNGIEENTVQYVQDKPNNFVGILEEYEVREIRGLIGQRSLAKIAEYYLVSPRTIARIRDGLTYTHVK